MTRVSWPGPSRSMSWPLLVMMLIVTMVGGVWPAAPATARSQPAAWDCAAPAAVATPGTSAAFESDPAAILSAEGALTVFAAASLTDAFEAMKAEMEAANPALTITVNFGGSQTLVTQLTAGAAADVFASANPAQMTAAADAGLIAGEPVTFVRNRLAIVTPAENPAGIARPADLGKDGIRLVLAQPEVPAGRYAREAVCAMAANPAVYGEDFVDRVAANVVSEEEDVRNALAKVQLGEADAGIVYVSDAAAGDAVTVIPIPDDVNVVAAYPVAAVTGGDESLAGAFIAYLLGAEGQATLQDHGFEPVA